ncbi:MAG: hypothetical protein ABSC65_27455, partial [Acidobacteriaceae bacterium]
GLFRTQGSPFLYKEAALGSAAEVEKGQILSNFINIPAHLETLFLHLPMLTTVVPGVGLPRHNPSREMG